MKPTRLALRSALLVVGASAALCAHAQNYFGFGLGRGHAVIPAVDSTYLGSTLTAVTGKTSDLAVDGYIGRQFTPYLGVEAGVVNLGNGYSARSTWLGTTSTINTYLWSLYGAVTGTLPLGSGLDLIGKIGLAVNSMSYSTDCSGTSCSRTWPRLHDDLMYGIGARIGLTDRWALRAEYENFGKMTDGDFWDTGNSGAIEGDAWFVNAQMAF